MCALSLPLEKPLEKIAAIISECIGYKLKNKATPAAGKQDISVKNK